MAKSLQQSILPEEAKYTLLSNFRNVNRSQSAWSHFFGTGAGVKKMTGITSVMNRSVLKRTNDYK